MCMLCSEIAKEKMNVREAASAYVETEIASDHLTMLMDEIEKYYGKDQFTDEVVRLLIQRRKREMNERTKKTDST